MRNSQLRKIIIKFIQSFGENFCLSVDPALTLYSGVLKHTPDQIVFECVKLQEFVKPYPYK